MTDLTTADSGAQPALPLVEAHKPASRRRVNGRPRTKSYKRDPRELLAVRSLLRSLGHDVSANAMLKIARALHYRIGDAEGFRLFSQDPKDGAA